MYLIESAINNALQRHWPFCLLRFIVMANIIMVPSISCLFLAVTWPMQTSRTIAFMLFSVVLTVVSAPFHFMLFERERAFNTNKSDRKRQYLEDFLNLAIPQVLFSLARLGMPTEHQAAMLLNFQLFFLAWGVLALTWEQYNDGLMRAELKRNREEHQEIR